MDLAALEQIRLAELNKVLDVLRRNKGNGNLTILEIGAGNGLQSNWMAAAGHEVRALDVPGSRYATDCAYPVQIYDGRQIPFPDRTFDVVFSSNVLEHVPDLECLNAEMRRVLKRDGIAVHLVPTGTWRLWTNLVHYPFLTLLALRFFQGWLQLGKTPSRLDANIERGKDLAPRELLLRAIVPVRHGETGNAISEIYHFSRLRWTERLESAGWRIIETGTNSLYYSGYLLMGASRLSLRRVLASVLGSSCHLFVLRASNPSDSGASSDSREALEGKGPGESDR